LKCRSVPNGGNSISFERAVENIMSFKDRVKKPGVPAMRVQASGFSMVELMIVCVVMLVIAGIAIPNIFRAYRNYQLDASGHSAASLLQQARMQAVKNNLPAYAVPLNAVPANGAANIAYVVNDPATAFVVGNPDVALASGISFQPPTDNAMHAQLDTYLGGATPVGNPQVVGAIGFNARGLPCASPGNPAVCTLPNNTTGFIWFMQGPGGWEAVTVTPAGRIKSWRASQSGGVRTWQ